MMLTSNWTFYKMHQTLTLGDLAPHIGRESLSSLLSSREQWYFVLWSVENLSECPECAFLKPLSHGEDNSPSGDFLVAISISLSRHRVISSHEWSLRIVKISKIWTDINDIYMMAKVTLRVQIFAAVGRSRKMCHGTFTFPFASRLAWTYSAIVSETISPRHAEISLYTDKTCCRVHSHDPHASDSHWCFCSACSVAHLAGLSRRQSPITVSDPL
jgi:hypothetical protein